MHACLPSESHLTHACLTAESQWMQIACLLNQEAPAAHMPSYSCLAFPPRRLPPGPAAGGAACRRGAARRGSRERAGRAGAAPVPRLTGAARGAGGLWPLGGRCMQAERCMRCSVIAGGLREQRTWCAAFVRCCCICYSCCGVPPQEEHKRLASEISGARAQGRNLSHRIAQLEEQLVHQQASAARRACLLAVVWLWCACMRRAPAWRPLRHTFPTPSHLAPACARSVSPAAGGAVRRRLPGGADGAQGEVLRMHACVRVAQPPFRSPTCDPSALLPTCCSPAHLLPSHSSCHPPSPAPPTLTRCLQVARAEGHRSKDETEALRCRIAALEAQLQVGTGGQGRVLLTGADGPKLHAGPRAA